MMGLYWKFAYKVLIIWPWWLISKFIRYIEMFDAAMLGFLTWLMIWHYKVMGTGAAIVVAIAVGAVLLALFHFSKIGFYISTVVFSLMWAYLIADYPASLVPGNKIVYWIAFTVIFAMCAFLHDFAKDRKRVKEEIAAEEATKQATLRRYEMEEEAVQQAQIHKMRLDFLERQNRLMEQRHSQ